MTHKAPPSNHSTAHAWFKYISQQLANSDAFLGHGYASHDNEAAALVLYNLGLFNAHEESLHQPLTEQQTDKLRTILVQRINQRIPTAYLTHQIHFAGIPFYVDERVIIPRSPFATLIQNQFDDLLTHDIPITILDLCCGSGCLGLAALCHCDFIKHATLTDISAEALQVAQHNVQSLHLQHLTTLIQSDLFSQLAADKPFDLIICNPPYVDEQQMQRLPKEYHCEPILGLQGKYKHSQHKHGLELIHNIIQQAPLFLKNNGILLLEVGASLNAFYHYYQQKLDCIELDLHQPNTTNTQQGMLLITTNALQQYYNKYHVR